MSLIEQAAKRLEELRRAGAELPGEPSSGPDALGVPTPEAVVHALHGRTEPTIPADWRGPAVAPVVAPVPPSVAPAAPARPVRRLDIDLAMLKQRGFVSPDMPQSQIADEFRVIKRPILRNALRGGVRHGNLVMVTSALPGEGKTFTAINLALSIAMEYDNTVLLVDGDVAHPSLPRQLGVPDSPGLLDLLTRDDVDVSDALVRTNIDKLSIMPAGSRHRRATELLASEQMGTLLRELASRYQDRIIIFDSPPLLATTEARVLATHMGQIVMVVSADATTQHTVNQALATIESNEIVLMLLNKAARSDVGTYYGYYQEESAG